MTELEGSVAFITGAAQGIGRATALLFAERGADLVLVDLREDGLTEVGKECETLGAQVLTTTADIGDSAQVDAAVEAGRDRFGRIDVLANIAGIFPFAHIVDMTDELWDSVQRTNLAGTFYCSRAVLRGMLEQESGSIINISSGAALRSLPSLSAYSASKAAVIAFSRTLALEAAPHVRVNVVAPGAVANVDVPVSGPSAAQAGAAGNLTDVPLGRPGRPQEIAEVIAFLASDRASYINGHVLHVNGGRIMA